VPASRIAALLGATDTAVFLGRRPRLFRDSPGRALGSVALMALWLAAAATARSRQRDPRTLATAAVLVAANAGLVAAHLRARISSPRIFAGAALSAVVLADALRR
jgi:hypothetical protein